MNNGSSCWRFAPRAFMESYGLNAKENHWTRLPRQPAFTKTVSAAFFIKSLKDLPNTPHPTFRKQMMVKEKLNCFGNIPSPSTPGFSEKLFFICARLRFDSPTEILCLESQNIS